jgi:hypothetical protein
MEDIRVRFKIHNNKKNTSDDSNNLASHL